VVPAHAIGQHDSRPAARLRTRTTSSPWPCTRALVSKACSTCRVCRGSAWAQQARSTCSRSERPSASASSRKSSTTSRASAVRSRRARLMVRRPCSALAIRSDCSTHVREAVQFRLQLLGQVRGDAALGLLDLEPQDGQGRP